MNANGDGGQQGTRPTTPADLEIGGSDSDRLDGDELAAQPMSSVPPRDDQPPGF
jgi:hypothetical protein